MVADGAGSAERALQGATLAVGGAAEAMARGLLGGQTPRDAGEWDRLLVECLMSARGAVEADGGPLHELSSTLLLGVLFRDTLAVAQVGDGWVVARDSDGDFHAVTVPAKGEYFNETVFVTSDSYLESASRSVESASRITGLAVLSDGLQTVACDLGAARPHPGFFGPLFDFTQDGSVTPARKRKELRQFLDSDRINGRTDDDKTLLLAVRSGRVVPAEPGQLPAALRVAEG